MSREICLIVCATNDGSDQSAQKRTLIRTSAGRMKPLHRQVQSEQDGPRLH